MSVIASTEHRLIRNPLVDRKTPYDDGVRPEILSDAAFEIARQEIVSWPGYRPTALRELPGLAAALGVASISYKDEGSRFGLGSFKALGGAYAVFRLLKKAVDTQTGQNASSSDFVAGRFESLTSRMTVTCATDGNHGRSVAWGAQKFGCRCVIYVHAGVSNPRCKAIASYGAEVRRVQGNYDESVRQAATDAERHGWFVVSDTSYPGYTDVPRDVMQGYSVMVEEALHQMRATPTHVFIQGGVGGLAAAACSHLWQRYEQDRPTYVVVEPDKAACLYLSAQARELVAVHGQLDTIMAGLACGEVSMIAWKILQPGADAFMTITDEAAADTMRLLAKPPFGDAAIVAGESAVAGLSGLIISAQNKAGREQLALTSDSVVLVFGTEGATDPEVYKKIIGRPAESIAMADA